MNPKQAKSGAQRYLNLADRDIEAFRVLKDAENVTLTITCFHAQQAVEKCLKAILALRKIEFGRTHDLYELASILLDNDIKPPLPPEEISKLNPYAVIFRYDDTEIEILTRNEATAMVEKVRQWAEEILTSRKH